MVRALEKALLGRDLCLHRRLAAARSLRPHHDPQRELHGHHGRRRVSADDRFVHGEGSHNPDHAGAVMPDTLRWLWREPLVEG